MLLRPVLMAALLVGTSLLGVAPADASQAAETAPTARAVAGGDRAPSAHSPMVTARLQNKNSGKCMNIPGGDTAEFARITQFTCGNWADHYWTWSNPRGDGWFWLVNSGSKRCLTIPNSNAGAQLRSSACGNGGDKLWRYEQFPDGYFKLINYQTGMCLAVNGGSQADDAPVIQWPCGAWADHFWRNIA